MALLKRKLQTKIGQRHSCDAAYAETEPTNKSVVTICHCRTKKNKTKNDSSGIKVKVDH